MRRRNYLLIYAIFMLSIFGAAFAFTSNFIKDSDNKEEQDNINNISNDNPISEEKKFRSINTLVLGLDGDKTRSDIIFMVNFNQGTGHVKILSIPRDTLVRVNGKIAKFNEIYGIGREAMVSSAIEKMTGLETKYTVVFDFKGFRKLIDTLGGIQIEVPFAMHYDDPLQNLHIHLKKGLQTLNGSQAEQFVRYRVSNGKRIGYREGDLDRIKVQHGFIKEFVRQKLQPKYITKVAELYVILKQHVQTNIGLEDIYKYLPAVSKISADNIEMFSLPGKSDYINGISYFMYDRNETEAIIKNYFTSH